MNNGVAIGIWWREGGCISSRAFSIKMPGLVFDNKNWYSVNIFGTNCLDYHLNNSIIFLWMIYMSSFRFNKIVPVKTFLKDFPSYITKIPAQKNCSMIHHFISTFLRICHGEYAKYITINIFSNWILFTIIVGLISLKSLD